MFGTYHGLPARDTTARMAVVLCGKLNYILPGLSNKKIYKVGSKSLYLDTFELAEVK